MANSEEIKTNLFTTLGEFREVSEELRRLEKKDNDNQEILNPLWTISYGESAVSYDDDLATLTKEKNLHKHIYVKAAEYREQGLLYCVYDPFAPTESWLNKIQKRDSEGNLPIDGGVASTLDDPRRNKSKILSDERKNLYCVSGDISRLGPRQELQRFMSILGIKDVGFGAVIARPYGGILEEKKYLPIYYVFLRQAWKITSKYDGEIFCPIPSIFSKSDAFTRWINLMKNNVGAEVQLSTLKNYMKIVKHPNSANNLPAIG